MTDHQPEESWIKADITAAELALEELGPRYRELWEHVRIEPQRWGHSQYVPVEPFWVVGLIGQRCLYFNDVEGGWGWGAFKEWGQIAEYHFEQLNIEHVIAQTLIAIDLGGPTLIARP